MTLGIRQRVVAGVRRLRAGVRYVHRKYRAGRVLLRELRKLARKEREWDVPLSKRRPKWWLQGFLSRSAVVYDLDRTDHDEYVSDLQRVFRTKRMVHARLQDVINNKLTTHLLLGAMHVRSPRLLGVFWRGAVHPFPTEERIGIVDYLVSLHEGSTVFFKVLAGAEGKNIYSVTRTSSDSYEVNGEVLALRGAADIFLAQDRPFIVEEGLQQHPQVGALYPHTVNTIRALTMLDLENGHQPFIAIAVQRIGCRGSEPADNWSRGGLSSQIDLETGALSPATRLPDSDVKEWFDFHPDTGAAITGTSVPFWEETRELIMHSARVLSFMEYVGWDVVIGPDGPLVLEANINTGVNVLQSHQPLFTDPRVRAYYAERGVRTDMDVEPPVAVDDPV